MWAKYNSELSCSNYLTGELTVVPSTATYTLERLEYTSMSRTFRPLAGLCGVSTFGIESSMRAQNWGSTHSIRCHQKLTHRIFVTWKNSFQMLQNSKNDGPQQVEAERCLTIFLSCSIFVSNLSCVQDELNVDNHCYHQKQHCAGLFKQKELQSIFWNLNDSTVWIVCTVWKKTLLSSSTIPSGCTWQNRRIVLLLLSLYFQVRYKLLCWRGMNGLARGLGVQFSIPYMTKSLDPSSAFLRVLGHVFTAPYHHLNPTGCYIVFWKHEEQHGPES